MAKSIISTQDITATQLNTALVLTVPQGADCVDIWVIEVSQGSGTRVYVTVDGKTPSSSVGAVLPSGRWPFDGELSKLRFLNESSSGCRIYAEYQSL